MATATQDEALIEGLQLFRLWFFCHNNDKAAVFSSDFTHFTCMTAWKDVQRRSERKCSAASCQQLDQFFNLKKSKKDNVEIIEVDSKESVTLASAIHSLPLENL